MRSRDSVYLEPAATLEGAYGTARQGTFDPVDRAPVKAEGAHRHLKRSDVRAAGMSRRGHEQPNREHQCESDRAHGTLLVPSVAGRHG